MLGNLASEWDWLVGASGNCSPFLLSWWLEPHAGDNPEFILFFIEDRIVGGIALEYLFTSSSRFPTVQYLGNEHGFTMQADLLILPEFESQVVELFFKLLGRKGPCRVRLSGMRSDGVLARHLPRRFEVFEEIRAPWSPLPATHDEFMNSRRRSFRRNVASSARRIESLGGYTRFVDLEHLPEALDALFALLEPTLSESQIIREYERFRSAATLGMKSGILTIEEMRLQNRTIASNVWFQSEGAFIGYLLGRDPAPELSGLGHVMISSMVGHACAAGFAELNMGAGDQEYKHRWADFEREIVRFEGLVGVRPRLLERATTAKRHLRRLRPTIR